jgi:hypothetical protein
MCGVTTRNVSLALFVIPRKKVWAFEVCIVENTVTYEVIFHPQFNHPCQHYNTKFFWMPSIPSFVLVLGMNFLQTHFAHDFWSSYEYFVHCQSGYSHAH